MARLNRYDYLSLLESCYGPSADAATWLARVANALLPVVDARRGLAVMLLEERDDGSRRFVNGHKRLRPEHEAVFDANSAAIEAMDDPTYRALYYPARPVGLSSSVVRRSPAAIQRRFSHAMAAFDAGDMLTLYAYPKPGSVVTVLAPVMAGFSLPRRAADGLGRLLLHLEAGLRLRLRPSPRVGAIFSTSGRLLHRSEALNQPSALQLAEHVKRWDALRARSRRHGVTEVLDCWQPLVSGRWTLAEQVEASGERLYVAFENEAHTWASRALTSMEASVVRLAAQGLLGKQVAAELGISEARASECLNAATAKLGLKRRSELLRFASELLRSPDEIDHEPLSKAERAVLDLVRSGHGNAHIARLLGKSERTVAHRVSALLEKTGCVSRRGLILARHRSASAEHE